MIADDDQSARSVISEDDAAEILRKTMLEAGKAYLSRAPVEVEVTIEDTLAEKSDKAGLCFMTASVVKCDRFK